MLPTVAIAVLLELHVAIVLRLAVDESLKTPVALNVVCPPIGIVAVAGVIEIETIVALVTVNVVEPATVPNVAVTVTVPGAMLEAAPFREPIVNTDVFDDDHVTCWVRLRVPPSLNVPVAVKKTLTPAGELLFTGVIEIDCRFATLTVNEVFPLTDSNAAEIVVVPMFLAVAIPLMVIVATEVKDEVHAATSVMS